MRVSAQRSRRLVLLGLLSLGLAGLSWAIGGSPPTATATALRPDKHTRSYRFKARVTSNDGVSPFRVGSTVTGEFTYDLRAKGPCPHHGGGQYPSPGHHFVVQLGKQIFRGRDVAVTTGMLGHAEHFQVVAFDLGLPPRWDMDHTRGSQTYGVLLQNAPSRGVVTDVAIPRKLKLSDWVTTKELRLDFFHGVRFSGGQAKGRATVTATVETLEPVR
jgi:hypothetical protein